MAYYSQEQIFEIQRYCTEKRLPLKKTLKQLGYSEWIYYQSKRHYSATTSQSSGFIPLKTACNDNKSTRNSSELTMEIRTVKGTEIRLIGNLDTNMLLNLIDHV